MMLGMMAANATGGGGGGAFAAYMLSLAPYVYYKLDETGTLTTAADSSGNGRHGTYAGSGTITDAAGLFAGSVRAKVLNSASSQRIHGPSATFAGTAFSVACMAASSDAAFKTLAGSDLGGGNDRIFRLQTNSGRAEFGLPGRLYINGTSSITDGNPHLVVATFDETLVVGAGRMKLYVDGALVAQSASDVDGGGNTALQLAFGAQNHTGALSWSGPLDECAFFTRALTSTEVSTLWANRAG